MVRGRLCREIRVVDADGTMDWTDLDGLDGRMDVWTLQKLNFANPSTGQQKLIDIDDERRVRIFYDKRMSQEVLCDQLGDEFKGYVVKITGGNDKQGCVAFGASPEVVCAMKI